MIVKCGVAEAQTVVQVFFDVVSLDLNYFLFRQYSRILNNGNKPLDFMLITHSDNPQS